MEEIVAITLEEVEEFLANFKAILLDPRVREVLKEVLGGKDCPAKQAILRLTEKG